MSDPAELFNSLRASTCVLLGYGSVDQLTAAQDIRVGRTITLRLIVDDLQARQLRGEMIDVKAFVAASEDLERLCGGNPNTPAPDAFADAREELSRFLVERAERIDARDVKLRDQIDQLKEENARLLAAKLETEPQQQPTSAAAATPEAAPNVTYLPSRTADGKPPPHYLQSNKHEPWRDGGTFEAPSWPLPR